MSHRTVIEIRGDAFYINGAITYAGCTYRGHRVEGLLFNSRMVQGIFDDLDDTTRSLWSYPDGPWDPQRNTDEFVRAMPAWRRAGLLSFTINLQGGNPRGYGRRQPWHNSAFAENGALRPDYMARLEQVLDAADELGMAPIVGFFYFGQNQRLDDEAAVINATYRTTDWLLEKGYTNLLIEIANEVDHSSYCHEILRDSRCHELIRIVQEHSSGKVASPAGRFYAGASLCGGKIPPASIVGASDFILLHGNGVSEPARIRQMVEKARAVDGYRGQPVLFNEDDHFAFEAEDNNMLAALSRYASWGYFDFRMTGEGYDEGYQSVPVNWAISSDRKRGFFNLLAAITGAASK